MAQKVKLNVYKFLKSNLGDWKTSAQNTECEKTI